MKGLAVFMFAIIYGKQVEGKTLTEIKRKASCIANQFCNVVDKLDIYFEEAYYCPDCYGNNKAFNQISLARRNIKRPNNTITYGE